MLSQVSELTIDCSPLTESLASLEAKLPRTPRSNLHDFFEKAASVALEFPIDLAQRLDQFSVTGNEEGFLLLRGLPVDSSGVPPTPPEGADAKERPLLAMEAWLALVGCRLGRPTGYRTVCEPPRQAPLGAYIFDLLQDLVPSPAHNYPSDVPVSALHFHSDLPYHLHRPRFTLLACSRPDQDRCSRTLVSSAQRVIPELSEGQREVLWRQPVPFLPDEAFRSESAPDVAMAVAVLSGSEADPRLAYTRDLVRPVTADLTNALQGLSAAVDNTAQGSIWEAGDLLIIDCLRTTYACTPYPCRADGTNRWLHRLFVQEPSANSAPGEIVEFVRQR
jgi:hypothetical protein